MSDEALTAIGAVTGVALWIAAAVYLTDHAFYRLVGMSVALGINHIAQELRATRRRE